jgi:hypothetical protein
MTWLVPSHRFRVRVAIASALLLLGPLLAAPVAIGVSSRDVVPISAAVAQEAAEQADEEAAVVS